jgi:hypothetical protein
MMMMMMMMIIAGMGILPQPLSTNLQKLELPSHTQVHILKSFILKTCEIIRSVYDLCNILS